MIDEYVGITDHNLYSQSLRDYCYKSYKDGSHYSDCSSSICYIHQQAGQGFGITDTAGMYSPTRLTTVGANITRDILGASRLRPGDMLLFAGTDASRPRRTGYVEIYCGDGIVCGHDSGKPSYKDLAVHCKSRYNP